MKCNNRFGECRCPQCTKFQYDPSTCEVVWKCHGCGNYDPYGVDGYTFGLKRYDLSTGDETHDYGAVLPRGRMSAELSQRYVLTATSPKCVKPRVYEAITPSTCSCHRGCIDMGLVQGARNAATLMLWDFDDYSVDRPDGRGTFVTGRASVNYDGVNSSHSFAIKTGSKGTYNIDGQPFSDCTFHYLDDALFTPYTVTTEFSSYEVLLYEIGEVQTDYWWNVGTPLEQHATATFKVLLLTGKVAVPQPGSPVSPPVPSEAIGGLRLTLQMTSYTDAWIPDSYSFTGSGGSSVPPGDVRRRVRAPGVDFLLTYGPFASTYPLRTETLGGSTLPLALSWCESEDTYQITQPAFDVFALPSGRMKWESFE